MNSPVGHWELQGFNDDSPNLSPLATQRICILANGTWYSTTFPDWHGRWFQKGTNAAGSGNRVRLLGNYAGGAGNDSAELDFVNARSMNGPWTEWRDVDSSKFRLWVRVAARFIGRKCPKPATLSSKATAAARKKAARQDPILGKRSRKQFEK